MLIRGIRIDSVAEYCALTAFRNYHNDSQTGISEEGLNDMYKEVLRALYSSHISDRNW